MNELISKFFNVILLFLTASAPAIFADMLPEAPVPYAEDPSIHELQRYHRLCLVAGEIAEHLTEAQRLYLLNQWNGLLYPNSVQYFNFITNYKKDHSIGEFSELELAIQVMNTVRWNEILKQQEEFCEHAKEFRVDLVVHAGDPIGEVINSLNLQLEKAKYRIVMNWRFPSNQQNMAGQDFKMTNMPLNEALLVLVRLIHPAGYFFAAKNEILIVPWDFFVLYKHPIPSTGPLKNSVDEQWRIVDIARYTNLGNIDIRKASFNDAMEQINSAIREVLSGPSIIQLRLNREAIERLSQNPKRELSSYDKGSITIKSKEITIEELAHEFHVQAGMNLVMGFKKSSILFTPVNYSDAWEYLSEPFPDRGDNVTHENLTMRIGQYLRILEMNAPHNGYHGKFEISNSLKNARFLERNFSIKATAKSHLDVLDDLAKDNMIKYFIDEKGNLVIEPIGIE